MCEYASILKGPKFPRVDCRVQTVCPLIVKKPSTWCMAGSGGAPVRHAATQCVGRGVGSQGQGTGYQGREGVSHHPGGAGQVCEEGLLHPGGQPGEARQQCWVTMKDSDEDTIIDDISRHSSCGGDLACCPYRGVCGVQQRGEYSSNL